MLRRLWLVALLLPLLLSAVHAQGDSTQLANTLLWRIEGKDLAAPSYLYGTCHVDDPRVFHFSDSLLPALHSCSTVATELRLDSLMWHIFTRLSRTDSASDLKSMLDPGDYRQLRAMLYERLGLNLDNYRHADPFVLRLVLDWMQRSGTQESTTTWDEPDTRRSGFFLPAGTFLDAWLSRYARLNRKEVIGLETYDEQIGATDTLTIVEKIHQLLSGYSEERASRQEGEKLLDIYAANDMEGFERMRAEIERTAPAYHRALLVVRNHTMARRMMERMNHTTLFTAVGALHLPGPDGLIALLRNAGYTLTPVMPVYANRYPKLPPLPSMELPWDSSSVALRGKTFTVLTPTPLFASPYDLTTKRTSSHLSMAIDIETGLTYMVAVKKLESSQLMMERDSILVPPLKAIADGTVFSIREMKMGETGGMEINGKSDDGKLVRARAIVRGSSIYLLTVYGGTTMLSSRDPDRFFGSFRFAPTSEITRTSLQEIAPGFSVHMPQEIVPGSQGDGVEIDTNSWQSTLTSHTYDQLFYRSASSSTFYEVMTLPRTTEQIADPDSSYAADWLRYGLDDDIEIETFAPTVLHDSRYRYASEFSLRRTAPKPSIRRRVLLVGGRTVMLTAIHTTAGPTTSEERAFFDSIVVAPPAPLSSSEFTLPAYNCRVVFPAKPEEYKDLATSWYSPFSWHNIDEGRAESWSGESAQSIVAMHSSPYLRVDHPDSLIEWNQARVVLREKADSPRVVEAGGVRWREYRMERLPGNGNGSGARYVRVGVHGATVYILTFLSLVKPDTAEAARFFNSFRLIDDNPQGDILSSKTERILEDLRSSDTTVRQNALVAVRWYRFRLEDMPLVYRALRASYPDDTNEAANSTLSALVWSVFSDTSDAQSVAELYRLHTRLPEGHDLHGTILGALARIGSPNALDTLMLLLPTDPMHIESISTIMLRLGYGSAPLDPLYPRFARYVDSGGWTRWVLWVTAQGLENDRLSAGTLTLIPEMENLRRAATFQLSPSLNPIDPDREEAEKGGRIAMPSQESWMQEAAAQLLGYLPLSKTSRQALRQGLESFNTEVVRHSAVSLLRHSMDVERETLAEIAETPEQGVQLYRDLQKFSLTSNFPPALATQERIGEGLLAEWLTNEEETEAETVEHLAVRVVQYHGQTRRAHLYRYRYEEGGDWYPALILQPESRYEVDASSKEIIMPDAPIKDESPNALVNKLLTME